MAEAMPTAAEALPANKNVASRYLDIKLSSIGVAFLYAFLLLENCFEVFLPALGYSDEVLFFCIVLFSLLKLWKIKGVLF